MANILDPRFDAEEDREGFTYRRARLGRQAGAERLGASVYDIPPGQATFPYHFHHANEELLVVLEGRPSLRTPEGWRELAPGDVVAFKVGPEGAHQLVNRSDSAVRVMVISEMNAPEVSEYPDSGKVGALSRAPGSAPAEGEFTGWFPAESAVDYWQDEPLPPKK
jgi:uncharacterized cupin superfamily protein